MPESISSQESRLWDAMYGDVKFLVLQYKLRNAWDYEQEARDAIVQLLQYHGKAQQEYWRFIRTLRLMSLFSDVLRSAHPDEVTKLVRRTDKSLFLKGYQPYLAKFWNWQFITKRQQAKKVENSPYKKWNWSATQEELKTLASERPNTFRYMLAYYEERLNTLRPVRPPSLLRVLRYMRDLEFDMESTG